MKQTLWVVGLVGVGLAAVALDKWRAGSQFVGLAFCLAAAARLSLPERQVGALAVRSRAIDAAVLLALGFGIVGLATAIPGR